MTLKAKSESLNYRLLMVFLLWHVTTDVIYITAPDSCMMSYYHSVPRTFKFLKTAKQVFFHHPLEKAVTAVQSR